MSKKSYKNLISEDEFWNIIEDSLDGKSKYSSIEQHERLQAIFQQKTTEELIGFRYHSIELYRKAFKEDLWRAAYIAKGGCGDDSFHYFRCWLVTRGKKGYYEALNQADNLITEFAHYQYREGLFDDGLHITVNEWYAKNSPKNIELSEIIEEEYEETFENKSEMEMMETIEFTWKEDDEASLKNLCPQLFERYWKNPLPSKYY